MRAGRSQLVYGALASSESDAKQKPDYLPSEPPLWASLFFTWYNGMIALGAKKTINKADMLLLPHRSQSKEILLHLIQCWKLQLLKKQCAMHRHDESTGNENIDNSGFHFIWVLHAMIFNEFWYAGFCRLVNDALVVFGAVLIKLIIKSAEAHDAKWTLVFAFVIFASSVTQTILLQQFIHGSFNCGSRVVSASTALIFRATLCLRLHKLVPQKTVGEINNIQAKDSSSLREFVVFFHNLWACPLMIIACVGLLLYMLGWAGLVSCILLPALIPLESYVTKQAKAARKSVLVYSDKRMALINEMIDGIWTIKLTTLVPLMYKNVTLLRDAELQLAWRGMLIEIVNTVITRSGTLVITLITFAVYVSIPSSVPLTADRAFAALAVINILGRPIQVIPKCVSLLSDAIVSCNRIEGIIDEALKYSPSLLDDILTERARGGLDGIDHSTRSAAGADTDDAAQSLADDGNEKSEPSSPVEDAHCVIEMKRVSAARMPSETVVLRDITLSLSQPGLIIITGGNASGKTSLLLAILNELALTAGGVSHIRFKGQSRAVLRGNDRDIADGISVAYCGHDPWIVNATAKHNILLASPAAGVSAMAAQAADTYKVSSANSTSGTTASTTEVRSPLLETPQTSVGVVAGAIDAPNTATEAGDGDDHHSAIYRSPYHHAITACALDQDFDSWVDGDESIVGEKGINISGGQKQRIALARAICSPAQIFLLDAPLSGLDVIVAKQVFNEGILEQSRHRLVIMTDCTYKQEVLAQASRILAMDRGRIVFDGSYSELCSGHILETMSSRLEQLDTGTDSTQSKPSKPHTNEADKVKNMSTNSTTGTGTTTTGTGSEVDLPSIKTSSSSKKSTDRHTLTASQSKRISGRDRRQTSNRSTKVSDDIGRSGNSNGGFSAYLSYAQSCGIHNISIAVILSFAAFAVGATSDYQVAFWTDGRFGATRFLFLYGLMSATVIVLHSLRYFMFSYSGITASRSLHDNLLKSILGATFPFFTDTPSGRITSRFSVDFDVIDFSIPTSLSSLVDSLLGILTGVGVVVVSSPVYILIVIPLTWQYYRVQARYRNVSKELKKIESGAKSPLFSHFREVLSGLETVRGFKIEASMCSQHHKMLDDLICARLNWDAANRWMGIRLDLIGSLIVSAAAFSVALSTFLGRSSGGEAGIILSYALKATQSMTFAIRASTALENMFTSPERVSEYIALEQEDPHDDRLLALSSILTSHDHHHSTTADRATTGSSHFYSTGTHNNNSNNNNKAAGRITAGGDRDRLGNESSHPLVDGTKRPSSSSSSSSSYSHLFTIHDEEAGVTDQGEPVETSNDIAIVAAAITAHYSSDLPPALKNLSFALRGGHLVGVCGRTGSGKSTLTLLLARAIKHYTGELTIFGKSYTDIPLAEYRGLVQVFPQNSYIFSGRLREFLDPSNRYSDSKLQGLLEEFTSAVAKNSPRQITEDPTNANAAPGTTTAAASMAAIGENTASAATYEIIEPEVQRLNLTMVNSAGGSNLSSGQKQVLALARAALADARVVLLDEITSNMDVTAAERAVTIVKRELVSRGVAVLFIAHSLTDVSMCDEVWVMSDGQFVEQGSPAELAVRAGGVFADMLNTKVGNQ